MHTSHGISSSNKLCFFNDFVDPKDLRIYEYIPTYDNSQDDTCLRILIEDSSLTKTMQLYIDASMSTIELNSSGLSLQGHSSKKVFS